MATAAKKKKATPGVRPLGDRVLIQRLEAEETTAGGIVIPDTAKEKPREGKVVALGDGAPGEGGERLPFQVEVGDRVLFTSYAGNDIKIGGEEYMIMAESEILAVIG